MPALRQPALGITASVLVIIVSLLFISPFTVGFFGGWLSFVMMCAIPFAIVVGAFWKGEEPARIARLGQPMRGIAYLVLAAAVAAVVALVIWTVVGGRVAPPLPMVAMATILSVVVAFFLWWLAVLAHPQQARGRHRAAGRGLCRCPCAVLPAHQFCVPGRRADLSR